MVVELSTSQELVSRRGFGAWVVFDENTEFKDTKRYDALFAPLTPTGWLSRTRSKPSTQHSTLHLKLRATHSKCASTRMLACIFVHGFLPTSNSTPERTYFGRCSRSRASRFPPCYVVAFSFGGIFNLCGIVVSFAVFFRGRLARVVEHAEAGSIFPLGMLAHSANSGDA